MTRPQKPRAHLRCVVPVTGTIAPACTGAVPKITKVGYLSDDYTDKKYLLRLLVRRSSISRRAMMSALPPKADMCSALAHVCFGPKADIGDYSTTSSAIETSAGGIASPSVWKMAP